MEAVRRLQSALDAFVTLLGWTAALLLAVICTLISFDVIVRTAGLRSFPWILDVVEYALMGATFLGAPVALRLRAHVSVDILVEALPARWRRRVELAIDLICALTCALLIVYGVKAVLMSYASGSMIFKEIVVPEWMIASVFPFAASVLFAQILLNAAGRFGEPRQTQGQRQGM